MSTRKVVIIIGAVVLSLGLIVVLFVGGIMGITLYSIGNSEAAETAKTFLRDNERLKQDIGNVKEFGFFVTGNINVQNNDGNATINLKVYGEQKTVNASVDMIYRDGRQWRVTSASYKTPEGETIELLNPYESKKLTPRMAA